MIWFHVIVYLMLQVLIPCILEMTFLGETSVFLYSNLQVRFGDSIILIYPDHEEVFFFKKKINVFSNSLFLNHDTNIIGYS